MLFLPVEKLKPGKPLEMDIYFFCSEWTVMLKKGEILSTQVLNRIKRFDHPGVYIKEPDIRYAKKPPLINAQLKNKALSVLKKAFDNRKDLPIEDVTVIADRIVDTVLKHKNILVNIMDLKSYDDYTFYHSLSVAVIAVSIGRHMNLSTSDLRQLSICGLLHDIGKIQIPKELINKPAPLTETEYDCVKKHALFGLSYLKEKHINSKYIKAGVISHHERYNGEGYPKGLTGKEIPLFGRIIAIADVFDALTSKRPYREPLSPADAAEYIMGNGDVAFDYEIVQAFMQTIEFYPPGTVVRLNTGKIAVVIRSEYSLRPVIKLVDAPDTEIDLFNDIDALNLTIVEVILKKQEQDSANFA